MPKRRASYLLLSVAAAGVATLPACSGTVSMEGSSGASGIAGSTSLAGATGIAGTGGGPCGGGPCGVIIQPAGGAFGSVGFMIEPGGAAGEIDSGGALNQGGGGPCGGHFCGSIAMPPGTAGEAGASSP